MSGAGAKPRGMANVAHVLASRIIGLHSVAVETVIHARDEGRTGYADLTKYQRDLADYTLTIASQIGPSVRRMVESELAEANVPANMQRWPQFPAHLDRYKHLDVNEAVRR